MAWSAHGRNAIKRVMHIMNLSNAWENFSKVYSSLGLAYFSVKRAGRVVNTVNHSLVLPQCFHPGPAPPKTSSIYSSVVRPIWCQLFLNSFKINNASTVHCVTFNTAGMSQSKMITSTQTDRFSKCGFPVATNQAFSSYTCGDCGVMWGWQIHQSYDICRLGGFSSPLLAWYCHHHADSSHRRLGSRSLKQQIQLASPWWQHSAVRITHCNMMKLHFWFSRSPVGHCCQQSYSFMLTADNVFPVLRFSAATEMITYFFLFGRINCHGEFYQLRTFLRNLFFSFFFI